jgi:hypothetical protein
VIVTLKSRLAKAERAASAREVQVSGPLLLLVEVGGDGRARFTVAGESCEVGSEAELDACLAARGWQQQWVIYCFPSLRDCPEVEARFRGGLTGES